MVTASQAAHECVTRFCRALNQTDHWSARNACTAPAWTAEHDYSGKRLYAMATRGGMRLNCGATIRQQHNRTAVLLHGYSKSADYAFRLFALLETVDENLAIHGFTTSHAHVEHFLHCELPAILSVGHLHEDATVRRWAQQQADFIAKDTLSAWQHSGVTAHYVIREHDDTTTQRLDPTTRQTYQRLVNDLETNTSRVVILTSAISGVGKSTNATQLSQHLARHGHRTLLIDGDLKNPFLSRQYETNATTCSLLDWLMMDGTTSNPIHSLAPNLDFIPVHHDLDATRTHLHRVTLALHNSLHSYDFIIVDTPPIVNNKIALLFCGADSDQFHDAPVPLAVFMVSSFATLPARVLQRAEARFESETIPIGGHIINHYVDGQAESRIHVAVERCISLPDVRRAAVSFRVRKTHEPAGRLHWLILEPDGADYMPIASTDTLDLETLLTIRQEGPWTRFD